MLILPGLWFANRKSVETPLTASAGTNAPVPASIAAAASQAIIPAYTNAPAAKITGSVASPSMSPLEGKGKRMTEALSILNDVPIVFYGKLIDQFGNPLAGAEITGSTIIYNGQTSRALGKRLPSVMPMVCSDSMLAKGESLGVMPRKQGYALATSGTEFKYSHLYQGYHVADPNNPVVIKMWKQQGAEPLLRISQRYKLHPTDEPLNFDLLTGKVVPLGGDIEITVGRAPGIVSERTLQDWSVRVEAVDGGLMDSSGQEAVTYWAPESGYQQSDSFIFSTNAPHKWSGGFTQGFFFTSRNGQIYGKLGLSFHINSEPDGFMNVVFGGVLNTNGSRNWEDDPDTMKAVGQ